MTKKIFENPDDRLRAMNVIRFEMRLLHRSDSNPAFESEREWAIGALKSIQARFEQNIIRKDEMLGAEE